MKEATKEEEKPPIYYDTPESWKEISDTLDIPLHTIEELRHSGRVFDLIQMIDTARIAKSRIIDDSIAMSMYDMINDKQIWDVFAEGRGWCKNKRLPFPVIYAIADTVKAEECTKHYNDFAVVHAMSAQALMFLSKDLEAKVKKDEKEREANLLSPVASYNSPQLAPQDGVQPKHITPEPAQEEIEDDIAPPEEVETKTEGGEVTEVPSVVETPKEEPLPVKPIDPNTRSRIRVL